MIKETLKQSLNHAKFTGRRHLCQHLHVGIYIYQSAFTCSKLTIGVALMFSLLTLNIFYTLF